MNTLKNIPKRRVYAAGISRGDKWVWQGTVVAENIKQASRFLSKYKSDRELKGRCMITIIIENFTERPKGVSNSLELF